MTAERKKLIENFKGLCRLARVAELNERVDDWIGATSELSDEDARRILTQNAAVVLRRELFGLGVHWFDRNGATLKRMVAVLSVAQSARKIDPDCDGSFFDDLLSEHNELSDDDFVEVLTEWYERVEHNAGLILMETAEGRIQ